MKIDLSGTVRTFKLSEDKEYTVTLYPLSPLKLQSITPRDV